MTQPSGQYTHVDGRPVVRFERTFPHRIDAVWAAVTDPQQLEQWFPTTVEFDSLSPGAEITFRFDQDAYPPMSGVVREVRPPERLVFTWGGDELSFELEERGHGEACRLALSVVLDSEDKAARDSAGWDACLDALERVVAGAVHERSAPSGDWQAYYDEYKRRGLPATAPIPE